MKIALLLSTYNEPSRTEMYEEVIYWWLKNSSFDIFVADSANNKFNEDIESQCSTFHYDQNLESINPLRHSDTTNLEAILLKLTARYFEEKWKEYEYVIKLTGKYTLSELEAKINNILLVEKFKIINQYARIPFKADPPLSIQHTELFAVQSKYFTEVIDDLVGMSDEIMEGRMAKLVNSEKYAKSRINLPQLKNTSNFPRGNSSILSAI